MASGNHSGDVAAYFTLPSATTPAWVGNDRVAFLSDRSGVPGVWIAPVGGGDGDGPGFPPATPIATGEDRVGALVATPDGERLVFGMDSGGDERQQLWTFAPEQDDAPRALTADPVTIHAFGAVSPDGRCFAFASNARDPRFFDILTIALDESDASPVPVLVADGLHYPVAWSPDGRHLIVRRGNTNLDHDLLEVPLGGGKPRLLTPHTGEATIGSVEFAPDGKTLLVVSNQDRDFAAVISLTLDDINQLPIVTNDWDIEALAVSSVGNCLAYAVNEDGASRLMVRDLASGTERPVTGLPLGVIEDLTWSPDGAHLAFSWSGPDHPSAIWVSDGVGRAWQVSEVNRGVLDRDAFSAPTTIRYPTFDGRDIPAFWYVSPGNTRPRGVVVDVHGGPEAQRRVAFSPVTRVLLAAGFAVLAPNVRGSTGYGKEYCHLDDVELRMDAVADLAAAVDWLHAQPEVGPNPIAVMGGSYGGFMALAALTTYPDRWAAGVDIVGIANFTTFLERTGPWRRAVRAAEYGDLERDASLLQAISPIHRAEQIVAPLVVIHGRNDPRVPLFEAEQIVATLRTLNREVEFMVFDDEGHGLVKRANRISGYGAVVRFLSRVIGTMSTTA